MTSFKPGVSLKDLQPQTVLAVIVVKDLFKDRGLNNFMITSCNDGSHMVGSLHYKGLAFDARTHDIVLTNRGVWLTNLVKDIKNALGPEFDVLLEDLGLPNEHLHVEFDPKPIVNKLPS